MKKLFLIAAFLSLACGQTAPNILPVETVNGITPVQFCPNVTPTYPTTFPEVAFCIQGNLYAVYSANDGFLTLIPPGVYSSNAVGSSCTFTVLNNCQIVN